MAKISIQDIPNPDITNQTDAVTLKLDDAETTKIKGGSSPNKGWRALPRVGW
jgi:hypothetical protein